jgi:hypothetical protein
MYENRCFRLSANTEIERRKKNFIISSTNTYIMEHIAMHKCRNVLMFMKKVLFPS